MTRAKKAPSVHKPPFDEASVLRFAEKGMKQELSDQGETAFVQQTVQKPEEKHAKESGPERRPFPLMLKPETIAHLQQEAFRKGKAVNQIVDKLVAKHLGKS